MKVLVTFQPGHGHFNPLIGLVKELISHGHEVTLVTSKSFAPIVRKEGFHCLEAGLDWQLSHLLSDFPELLNDPSNELGIYLMRLLLSKVAVSLAKDLIALMDELKPDVVICDHTEFGGRIAAEYCHIPIVIVSAGIRFSHKLFCMIFEKELSQLRSQFGLPDGTPLRNLYPSLILNFVAPEWFVGPGYQFLPADRFLKPDKVTGVGNEDLLTSIINKLPKQPIIHASLGTIHDNTSSILNKIISAFIGQPWNLIITVRDSVNISAEYGVLPPNICITNFIPHSKLLPYCDALITHGGFSSLITATYNELPVLVLPLAFDEYSLMLTVLHLGIGLTIEEALAPNRYQEKFIDPNKLTDLNIQIAIRCLLGGKSHRKNVQLQKKSLERQAPMSQALGMISSVVSHHAYLRSFNQQVYFHNTFSPSKMIWDQVSPLLTSVLASNDPIFKLALTEITYSMPESSVNYKDILKLLIVLCIVNELPELSFLIYHLHESFLDEISQAHNPQLAKYLSDSLPRVMVQGNTFQPTYLNKRSLPFGSYTVPRTYTSTYASSRFFDTSVTSPRIGKEISIVIPVKDNQEGIDRLLASFVENTPKAYYPDSIIIVDNNSSIPIKIQEQYSQLSIDIVLSRCSIPGAGAARNQGAQLAKMRNSGWLLFIDSDCIFTSTTISGYLGLGHSAIAYQGLINSLGHDWLSRFYSKRQEMFHPTEPIERSITFLITANALVKVSAFDKINGFNEELSISGEDIDLAARLMKIGKLCHAPNSKIDHDFLNGESCVRNKHLLTFLERFERYGQGYQVICKKHGEFNINRDNHDALQNFALYFYAKRFGPNIRLLKEQLNRDPEGLAKELSYLDLRVMMFKAHQEGDKRVTLLNMVSTENNIEEKQYEIS